MNSIIKTASGFNLEKTAVIYPITRNQLLRKIQNKKTELVELQNCLIEVDKIQIKEG